MPSRSPPSATRAAVDAGLLTVADPDMASFAMWAAVHGVAEVLLLGFGSTSPPPTT